MIFTDRTVIVQKGTSSINDTIILYRGDKGVEIRFTLNEGSPFRFGSGASPNIIEKTEAAYGQLIIKRPNDLPAVFSEIAPTNEGKIVFTITAEMIDEITEVGNYTFQIRLLDESRNSRATLPEVVNGIEIREPIATEDVTDTNEVGVATVGYALTTVGTTEDTFDSQGNYNKTTWTTGDRITASKLNKMEAAIDGVNKKVASGETGGGVADSVDWSNVQNKPTIPTNTSQLTNDSGFITNVPDEYITETELNARRYASEQYVDDAVNNASISGGYTHPATHPASMITGLSTVATSGSYNDLTDKPTIPTRTSELANNSDFVDSAFVSQKIAEASLSGGEVDLSAYQTKTDNVLNTTDKTVVGAINEINETMVIAEEQAGDITVGGISVGGSSEAKDITITDVGGYYEATNVEGALQEAGSQIKEIKNNGVTTETVENKVQSVIDAKIADGTIANLTIADGSITKEKLDPNISFGLDRTINLFELEGAKVYNYYKEEKCKRYEGFIYNPKGEQSPVANAKVIKIPVKSNVTYCLEGFGSAIVYSINVEDLNEKFIKNVSATKENNIFTFEISGVTDSVVYLAVSYKNYVGNIKLYESDKLFDSNEYKVEIDNLVAPTLSEAGKNEIISSISEKIAPLPITRDYLNTTTDNYLNKNEIIRDKIYNTDNTETDNANKNYVKVKIKPGETYVDNFYNSSRILFDKDMNYISNGISGMEANSSYKTAKYTICNLDDFYCYMVINFDDAYITNPFVIKSDILESAYDYAEFTHKFDIISSGVTSRSINEMSLKTNMLPYVLDGIGCTNYWDAQYNIDNLLKNDGNYVQSAINYLPPGTYTINNCGILTRISLDGKIDKILGSNTNLTFEMTEDYCRYTAYIRVNNDVEKLRDIIVQKGTTTDGVKERKYTFDNFKVKNIGYYPTHWEGKKYVAIGDSITRGYAPANSSLNITEGSQIELPYAKYAAQKLGLEFQNLGEDGATVSSFIGYNVFNKIKGTPDIISIYLGANDISKLSLGTIDDVYTEGAETCTYYGGLKYIVKKLKETYPLAMIILIGNTYTTTRVSSKVDEFNKAKKDIATLYNVLYLDMARATGFDLSFEGMVTELQLNSIHPNYKAHEIMGSRLTGFIASH